MIHRVLAVVPFLTAFGCSSTESTSNVANSVEGCREQYAASKGYGYQDDPGVGMETAAAPADAADASVAQPDPLSPLDQAVAECQSGDTSSIDVSGGGASTVTTPPPQPGTDCDPSQIMTHDAAVCLARAQGLAEGLEGLAAGISFNTRHLRIVWAVKNTTQRSSDAAGGSVMIFDAITGKLLALNQWKAIA